jgi:hypothetical protein
MQIKNNVIYEFSTSGVRAMVRHGGGAEVNPGTKSTM